MDGVLFDTENLILQNWKELAVSYGYAVEEMEEVFYSCIGTNARVTRELVLGHYGNQFPYDEFRKASSVLFREKVDKYGMPVKKGARELLAYLKKEKYRLHKKGNGGRRTRKCRTSGIF